MGRLRSVAARILRVRRDRTMSPLGQLAVVLPRLIRALPHDIDGSAESELLSRLPRLLARVDRRDMVRAVPAFAKVAYHHLEQGSIDDVRHALNAGLLQNRQHDASTLDAGPHRGQPVVHLPGWDDDSLDRGLFVLADRETTFVGAVVRVRTEGDRVRGVVRAGVTHIDTDDVPEIEAHTPGVSMEYSGETSGHRATNEDPAHWRATLDRSTWRFDAPAGSPLIDVTVRLAGREVRGTIDVNPPVESDGPLVEFIDLRDDSVIVQGRGLAGAVIASTTVTVQATEQHSTRLTFPVRVDRPGRPGLPWPMGHYVVELDGVPIPLSADLAGWPTDLADGPLRAHTTATGLRVVKPRRDDENTMYGQRALRVAYRDAATSVDPNLAMFQCYWAEVATDSQLAIHRELRRRRPDMTLAWGVADHSVALPEGAVPIVAGTRAWYEALASAKFLIKNTEVGAYTCLRPGQVYLQTFHGQPFKQMGRGDFARRMPPWRADYEATARRSEFWSAICVPYPEAAEFYRDNYGWTGPSFDHGLPRTDALLAPDSDAVRRRTRELLGIGEHQTTVLHATTWRDDLTLGGNTSADPGLLDVHALAADLGDDFVVLQRSHHSVARSDLRVGGGAGVIDVTDYPEINDLILASDLAILDYSSLRFDFALTGRPMIFFVPDLDDYRGRLRGFLFDFEESAPGPLIRDARLLPDLVRDSSWSADHASAYEDFNQRFNRFHDGHAAERVVDGLLGWDA